MSQQNRHTIVLITTEGRVADIPGTVLYTIFSTNPVGSNFQLSLPFLKGNGYHIIRHQITDQIPNHI